jgi:predicted transcriptional regulator
MKELRNFHLPLPDDLYARLRAEAERTKQPATMLARQAIEAWLGQRRRAAIHKAISAYAAQHAGSHADLDPVLESAALELLASQTRGEP